MLASEHANISLSFEALIYKTRLVLYMSSYLFSLVFPVSMTNTTSGIVTPVSAMLVDKTIWKQAVGILLVVIIVYSVNAASIQMYLSNSSRGHCEGSSLVLGREWRVESNDPEPEADHKESNEGCTFPLALKDLLQECEEYIMDYVSPVFVPEPFVRGEQVE